VKDLTKIKTPFGLLGKKTRKALQEHWGVGGEIEYFDDEGVWVLSTGHQWLPWRVYRKKQIEPVTPVLSSEYREMFEAALARPDAHPIFAAVKEWQEAFADTYITTSSNERGSRLLKACDAIAEIKVPS